ncbi:low affinity iron permease family protein [Streptomyces sp. NPDC020362]|uniref:low affinity iron permease family protein n=1 Tax=unclassified Streptomyces TaxID=2593676 RepID=UPI000A483004
MTGSAARAVVMTLRHPAERGGAQRGWFARFAEVGSTLTASAVFFMLCLLLVIAVHVASLSLDWQHVAGDAMGALTLLLLALLKNAERRAEHAVQRKLDALARALLKQWAGEQEQARQCLEEAIGMEEQL